MRSHLCGAPSVIEHALRKGQAPGALGARRDRYRQNYFDFLPMGFASAVDFRQLFTGSQFCCGQARALCTDTDSD